MSDIEEKIREILRRIEDEVLKITREIEELVDKGEVRKAYRLWRVESRRLMNNIEENLKSIEKLVKKLDRKIADKIMKEVYDKIDHVLDKLIGLAGKLGVEIKRKRIEPFTVSVLPVINETIASILDNVLNTISNIRNVLEDRLKEIASSMKVSQVISIRMRENDLKIIDQLVEAGIFKSRSEAISFFARKGIDASREWIKKALDHAKKIKELQESIRKELEKEEK